MGMVSKSRRGLLKVGLIGRGRMGLNHQRIIEANPLVEIVGLADPTIQDVWTNGLGGKKLPAFRSAIELLEGTSPDVVHIVTPPETHFDLAKLAIEAGTHVYVEKPFVLSEKEAETLYDIATAKNLRICAGHQLLFERPVALAASLIAQIGNAVHIESYFSFRPVRRSIPAVEQLFDILPHPVCLLVHFLELCNVGRAEKGFHVSGYEVSRRGEVRAIISRGECYGILVASLKGRPVESYLKISGTNGSLYLDFIRGTVITAIGPGASAISAILNPYNQARQILTNSTKAFAKLLTSREKGYLGLSVLVGEFYKSIVEGKPSPTNAGAVIQTVKICENLYKPLKEQDDKFEEYARSQLVNEMRTTDEQALTKGTVLVTGGNGFLGQEVVKSIIESGWAVRVVTRKSLPYSRRIAGVDYRVLDLSEAINPEQMKNVSAVIHCAAETAGSQDAHERNTVKATKNLLEACVKEGVEKVIHISSIAVLKPDKVIDEQTEVDWGNPARGSYVWAKAEAEKLVFEAQKKFGLKVKIIRPGPLVDYTSFQPPARLGKEVGPIFVAVGSKTSKLSVCDVKLAAQTISGYIDKFDELPDILNLVEPDAPTRERLVQIVRRERPDLRTLWMPWWVLAAISPVLKLMQKMLFPGRKPIDIYAIFSSETYRTNKARAVIHELEKGENWRI